MRTFILQAFHERNAGTFGAAPLLADFTGRTLPDLALETVPYVDFTGRTLPALEWLTLELVGGVMVVS